MSRGSRVRSPPGAFCRSYTFTCRTENPSLRVRIPVGRLFFIAALKVCSTRFTCVRPCGAMDSALDFGSSGCGFESHQGRFASVAQWIAHRTSNPGVAGSTPAGGVFFSFKKFSQRTKTYNTYDSRVVPHHSTR